MSWSNIGKIPELQRRMLYTVGILAAYRVGVHIPVPGVNLQALSAFFQQQQQAGGTLFGLLNTFTGGGFNRMSVFALGIMPYITASIILDLLTVVFPYLDKLKKEGEVGRKKITQYTRYFTIVLSAVQSVALASWVESLTVGGGGGMGAVKVVSNPGLVFVIMTVITMTAGTALIMWLGEQITERGIGNGISLIIFAGIVARIPAGIYQVLEQFGTGEQNIFTLVAIVVGMVAVVAAIVLVERAQRRISVQYPARIVGRKMSKGVKTHLPLKVNTAGVIPPIFASSLLMFPSSFLGMIGQKSAESNWAQLLNSMLNPSGWQYNTIYGILIIFFTYFYTAVQFNPIDVADNLKKHGGYIPGVRPGQNTADYIDRILTRITLGGSLYLVAVCVLPSIFIGTVNVPFYYGGTSLLIVVGVAMDTASQMEAHLIARHYDGFLGAKGPRMKGRRGR
jgi:preprotein translocase subunit SecY